MEVAFCRQSLTALIIDRNVHLMPEILVVNTVGNDYCFSKVLAVAESILKLAASNILEHFHDSGRRR